MFACLRPCSRETKRGGLRGALCATGGRKRLILARYLIVIFVVFSIRPRYFLPERKVGGKEGFSNEG